MRTHAEPAALGPPLVARLAAGAMLLLGAGCAPLHPPPLDHPWRVEDLPVAGSTDLSLEDLAGTYGSGTAFSWGSLTICADGEWEFIWNDDCFSFPEFAGDAASHGFVRLQSHRVIFVRTNYLAIETGEWVSAIPVRWGRRLYLVGDRELADFVNDVNWGQLPDGEWPRGWCLRIVEGEPPRLEAPARDGPDLPAEWGARILAMPVEGTIVRQEADGTWTANVGSDQGVFPGMLLECASGDGSGRVDDLVVESCSRSTCRLMSAWESGQVPQVPAGARVHCPARGAAWRPR